MSVMEILCQFTPNSSSLQSLPSQLLFKSVCSCELGFFVISNWLCWQCQLWRSFANSHPIPQVCRVSQVNYFSSQVTKMSIFQSNMKQIVMSYRSWFSFVHFQSRVFFRCIHILCRLRFNLQTFPLYIFQVRERQVWVCIII